MTPRIEIKSASRLISLVRILLFALSVGIIFLMGINELVFVLTDKGTLLITLFIGVALAAILLAIFSGFINRPWILMLQLIFDALWVGAIVYLCGGVLGPAAPLIYAIVIIATLLLPSVLPFLLSSIGALVLGANALLYIAEITPFEDVSMISTHDLGNAELIISAVTVQVIALFLIDILGQILARRTNEQQLIVGDLLDQVGDGILLIDKRGVVRHINEQAIKQLRLPDETLEGQDCPSLLNAETHAALLDILIEKTGVQTAHLSLGGRYLMAVANDVHGRRGRLFGRMVSLRDETEIRTMEENARRSEHLASLGEMAAGIAHEFRNPLTSLRGCAQEIHSISKEKDYKDTRKMSKIIIKESDRMSRIVNDVLGFARQHSLYLQPLNLTEFLQQVRDEYKEQLDFPEDILLSIKIESDCPSILSDIEKLRQVVHNLIDNALHALEGVEHAQIMLIAELAQNNVLDSANEAVALRVVDNGSGIPKEKMTQVFTPFYSGSSQGTGIGLSLVQRLVRALGGVVRLESELGEGTTVSVLLPVAES